MRGLYCLVVGIPSPVRISIDSLDPHDLPAGVYVYVVGSTHTTYPQACTYT
jgi:Uri superfamily endonuclease